MKQTQSGKAIPRKLDRWDISSLALPWIFIALVTAAVTTIWFDVGPVLGIPASIMGAIIAWRTL